MWVDRYRPKTSKNIIGQQGDKSCAKKLAKWLQDWQRNRTLPAGKESSETGASFRAALLSGPPGIGKTTTATIVCEVRASLSPKLNTVTLAIGSLLKTVCVQPCAHVVCITVQWMCCMYLAVDVSLCSGCVVCISVQ